MSSNLTTISVLVVALYAAGAHAEDAAAPMFSFSGFGTLGLVHSSEDKADFTGSVLKPHGAGYSRNWSAEVDSRIAAQVTANLTPQLSAVLQVISEQNADNSYRPQVEWANVKYQFTPDFSVRVGRAVLPAFLLSETRKVAYTYPWVRPPMEVYHLLPVTANDGLDMSYRLHIGEWVNTLQAQVGRKNTELINNGGIAEARNSWGISNTTEYGPLTTRIAYQKSHVTVASMNSLFNAFRQFGPQGALIADKYDPDAKAYTSLGIGASYEPGNWFVMGEWGGVNTHSFIGKRSAWYVSGGFRVGEFTPYVTYAQVRADNLSDPGLTVSALPPFLAGEATGLNTALNSILRTKIAQNTLTIGGRWDFNKNTALKLQFDHIRIGAGSTGALVNLQPSFQLGGKVNVFSATLDFVF
jgi:hypothetical protein